MQHFGQTTVGLVIKYSICGSDDKWLAWINKDASLKMAGLKKLKWSI